MMKSLLHSHKTTEFSSEVWRESSSNAGVSFGIRRPSLGQRIELTMRARELSMQHEFLKAGDASDQLTASLSELLVRKLYLEWGLIGLKGLRIDGDPASVETLISHGPEALIEEIVAAVLAESGLTEDETKNS